MKKIVFIFIIILIFINLISAIQLRINPSHIVLNGNVNENICEKLNISTDYSGNVIGQTRWSREDSKKLSDYSLGSDELNLRLDFPDNIKINSYKEINFCLSSEDPGEFYGALLYHTEDSPAGASIF